MRLAGVNEDEFESEEEQERKKVIKLNFMSIRIGIKIKKLLRSFLFFHKMLSTSMEKGERNIKWFQNKISEVKNFMMRNVQESLT